MRWTLAPATPSSGLIFRNVQPASRNATTASFRSASATASSACNRVTLAWAVTAAWASGSSEGEGSVTIR